VASVVRSGRIYSNNWIEDEIAYLYRCYTRIEMQQTMERLLAKVYATKEKTEANTKAMREDIKSGQAEMSSYLIHG
jgi:hypothetical protein